jgi:hypothetical protein
MLESCSAVPWSLKLIKRLSAQELLRRFQPNAADAKQGGIRGDFRNYLE